MINTVYIVAETMLLFLGVSFLYLFFGGRKGSARIKFRVTPKSFVGNVIGTMRDDRCDEVFERAGIRLSIGKYTAGRNLLTLLLFLIIAIKAFSEGVETCLYPILLIAIIYYLSDPHEYLKGGKRTLFKVVLDKSRGSYLERKDDELMSIVTQFKNLIVSQSTQPRSAESTIESLLRFTTVLTRPIFAQTLSMIRLSKMEEAAKYFADHFGTKIGDDFSTILYKLDALDPSEFLVQINSFQDGLREEKRTRRQKKQEEAGRHIFLLASCVISLVMFDYMYILFTYLMQEMAF